MVVRACVMRLSRQSLPLARNSVPVRNLDGGRLMLSQHQVAARNDAHSYVPLDFANAATRYQAFREVEAEHLELMSRHNLLDDWTPEIRATVLAARHHIREAAEARARFRGLICDYV